MNLQKRSICFIGSIAALVLSCVVTVSAASIQDGTDDIWRWKQSGTAWSWNGNVGDKPNIDITEVSSSATGNKVTLMIEVDGTIQASETIFYYVYFNSTDSNYTLVWSNGRGYGWAVKEGSYGQGENITVSEDTISAEFTSLGDTSTVDLWGYAVEYTVLDDQTTHDWWGDWAPNTKFTGSMTPNGGNNSTNDTTGDNGTNQKPSTPGFEALAVIAAVGLIMILIRRNR